MKKIRAAIIGFGGIARAHAVGYRLLAEEGAPVELVAVCDVDPKRFEGAIAINMGADAASLPAGTHTYTDVGALIKSEDFDMADICLPTYLHKEYAVRLLAAGKHVLSEKPMALTGADCREMIAAAKAADRRLMIGQCLRFNTHYSFLQDCVEDGRYGKLRHLFMERLSALPTWGYEQWFQKTECSGGCILDMHIHDVDMARYLLGEPEAVSTVAMDGRVRWQVENTRLYYKDSMIVINGSWDEATGTPFRAGFRARFERASLLYDGASITVCPDGGERFAAPLTVANHMAEEIGYFASLILDPEKKNEKNPPESACRTVELVELLCKSADNGSKIIQL